MFLLSPAIYPNNTKRNFRSHSHTHTPPPSLADGLLRTPADRPRIPPVAPSVVASVGLPNAVYKRPSFDGLGGRSCRLITPFL